jgi:hypothetical protein
MTDTVILLAGERERRIRRALSILVATSPRFDRDDMQAALDEIDRLRATANAGPLKPSIRELLCQFCDREYVVWFAPNDLWNRVVGDRASFLCPTCFTVAADEAGVEYTAFEVRVENKGTKTTGRGANSRYIRRWPRTRGR